MIYVLKSSICLLLLLLIYKLFLERENLHVLKRFYLLFSLIAAYVIPLITFRTFEIHETSTINFINSQHYTNGIFNTVYNEPSGFWVGLIFSIYIIGLVLSLYKFIKNIKDINLKINTNLKIKDKEITIVLLKEDIEPYSFFNYVFINESDYKSNFVSEEVMIHERAHANQKHTSDLILIELFKVVFWFNPLLIYVKEAVKLNHEFLADKAVIKKGLNIESYQLILLDFFSNQKQNSLVSSISSSGIKKRFLIMNKKLSKSVVISRILIIGITFLVMTNAFSQKITVPVISEQDIRLVSVQENKEQGSRQTLNEVERVSEKVSSINEIHYLMEKGAVFKYKSKNIPYTEINAMIKQHKKLNFSVLETLPNNKLLVKLFVSK